MERSGRLSCCLEIQNLYRSRPSSIGIMESILDDSTGLPPLAVYQSLHIQEENREWSLNYRTAETWISRSSSTSNAKNRKNLFQTWALANKLTDLPLDQLHELPLYSAKRTGYEFPQHFK